MKSTDDPSLSMEELERIRAELQSSIRNAQEMLAHAEALLIAAAMIRQTQAASAIDTPSRLTA